ncbi:CwfJ C-terminus 1-domain-containing protein-like protein [Tirmania nivea]|nr:CwfJ C-terminus 1-domain-containing protein-like protein [Tirmania nivea]
MAAKIIVIGATHGSLPALLPKLTALHSKQQFTLAIILGDVFSPPSSSEDESENEFIQKLFHGEIEIPLPAYFSVGKNELPKPIKDRLESREGKDSGGEVCSNLFFLGRKGILVTSEGVRIVVLGGREGNGEVMEKEGEGEGENVGGDTTRPWYTTQEASALKGANSADILVTYDWPENVDGNSKIPVPQAIEGGLPSRSRAVRELARRLRPKYHFLVGGEEVFWEREPYMNGVLGKERERIASGGGGVGVDTTRVIALANWGNKGKVKSVYAFNLNVSDRTTVEALPPNTTESPYAGLGDTGKRKRPLHDAGTTDEFPMGIGDNGAFFWGDWDQRRNNRRIEYERRGKRGRGGGRGGHHNQSRLPPGPESCFFCLSNPTLAKHLLVSIGTDAYLTTAKGPLTTAAINPPELSFPGHVLVIPLSHSPTLAHIDDAQSKKGTYTEMIRYRAALDAMFRSRSCGAVCFEVARRTGVHTHWQVLPLRTSILPQVEDAFKETAKKENYGEFVESFDDQLGDVDRSYFRVWISGMEEGKWLVLAIKEGQYFDLQFGRKVVAGMIGGEAEKRANWKDCEQSMEEEVRDTKGFKEGFKEFDFTL